MKEHLLLPKTSLLETLLELTDTNLLLNLATFQLELGT